MLELIANVASSLGANFEPMLWDGDAQGYIVMPDGVKMFVHAGGYGNVGKIIFSDSFPKHVADIHGLLQYTGTRNFSSGDFDGIKVSDNKSPEQIAKDVARRFLPTYAPLYAQSVEWCGKQADYWKKKNEMSLLGEQLFGNIKYAQVAYVGDTTLRVNVSELTADNAKKLAALLATF